MDHPAAAPLAVDVAPLAAAPPAAASVKKKPTLFQKNHIIEYGVKVCHRDVSGTINGVQCMFCIHIGKDERVINAGAPQAKRQRTTNTMIWSVFRPALYRSHHESQHTSDWNEYKKLSSASKKTYFDQYNTSQLNHFLPKVKAALIFNIKADIVEKLIGDLFFHPEEDDENDGPPITKANAMKLFKVQADGSYQVEIKNEVRFNLAMDYISAGLSFRQSAKVMGFTQKRLKNPLLVGLNDHMVGQYARIIVGTSLQDFANILSVQRMWAFALAFDSSTHQGTSFFDIRIRLAILGNIHNLHLVTVPNFQRHTAVNTAALIYTIMDCTFHDWRTKLIGLSTDGENTMTGRYGGVVTLVEREATNQIIRVWCPIHQIDLHSKNAINTMTDGEFYKTAHNLSVHLRKQANLITEMQSTCPKDTNRWVHFGNMISWMITNRRRIKEHLIEKAAVCSPSETWWILAAAVAPIISTVNVTLTVLQGRDIIISQQQRQIDNLVGNLCSLLEVKADEDVDLDELDDDEFFQEEGWCILIKSVSAHFEDQGSWARDILASLSEID